MARSVRCLRSACILIQSGQGEDRVWGVGRVGSGRLWREKTAAIKSSVRTDEIQASGRCNEE